MSPIDRRDLADHELFGEIMRREKHHAHEIVMTDGIPRWKESPDTRKMVDKIGLNDAIGLFASMGYTRNSEAWRKLYRDIGTSLFAYWETFYWEANNEAAAAYREAEMRDEKIDDILEWNKREERNIR
jgi:hypothetical protein